MSPVRRMPCVGRFAVCFARRPWLYWLAVTGGRRSELPAIVHDEIRRTERIRDSWASHAPRADRDRSDHAR